jgi:hypothetical protein
MRAIAILSLVFALLVAACGGGSEQKPVPASGMPIAGGGLSVSEALASDLEGPLQVKGYLVERGGELRLCTAVLESQPPQCGEPSLAVAGDASGADQYDASGLVSLLGEVEGGTITVSAHST